MLNKDRSRRRVQRRLGNEGVRGLNELYTAINEERDPYAKYLLAPLMTMAVPPLGAGTGIATGLGRTAQIIGRGLNTSIAGVPGFTGSNVLGAYGGADFATRRAPEIPGLLEEGEYGRALEEIIYGGLDLTGLGLARGFKGLNKARKLITPQQSLKNTYKIDPQDAPSFGSLEQAPKDTKFKFRSLASEKNHTLKEIERMKSVKIKTEELIEAEGKANGVNSRQYKTLLKNYKLINDKRKELDNILRNIAEKESRILRDKRIGNVKKMYFSEALQGIENKKAITRGNEWMANWKNDPATIQKIIDASGNIPIKTVEAAIELQPNVKEFSLSKMLKLIKENKRHPLESNQGVSLTHRLPYEYDSGKKYRKILEDYYGDYGDYVSRDPAMSQSLRESVTVHEATHGLFRDNLMKETGQFEMFKRNTDKSFVEDFKYFEEMTKKGFNFQTVADRNKFFRGYIADPTEQHARIMQVRHQLNLKPSDKVSIEKAKEIIEALNSMKLKNINPLKQKLLAASFSNDPKKLQNVMNKAFSIATPAVGGTALLEMLRDYDSDRLDDRRNSIR